MKQKTPNVTNIKRKNKTNNTSRKVIQLFILWGKTLSKPFKQKANQHFKNKWAR